MGKKRRKQWNEQKRQVRKVVVAGPRIPRCDKCGSKIKSNKPVDKDYKSLVWEDGKEWPKGSFRANCRKCGAYVIALPNGEIHGLEGLEMWNNMAPEVRDVALARQKQREGMPTIVMIGTSPDSAGLVPWDEPGILGFWALNDAHVLPFMRMDRITRWYQLHFRWRFTRRNPRYGENDHWSWLQRPHDFPIVMQKRWEDVPASVEFPLRKLTERFLLKRIGRGDRYQRKYYTCSFSFVLADAIAFLEDNYKPKDFDPFKDPPYARIEMYGVELAQEIEYIMQRPGTEFWIGMAAGRGIQLYFPTRTRVMSGVLYGYRWPDRKTDAKALFDHKTMEGEPITIEKAWEEAAGENLPDEDNVGPWNDYPDNSQFPGEMDDDPYGFGILLDDAQEDGEETSPFLGDPNAAKSAVA